MKSLVNENIWKGFDDKDFDVPIIYYAASNCYIVNPTEKFIDQYKPELVFRNNKIVVSKTLPDFGTPKNKKT